MDLEDVYLAIEDSKRMESIALFAEKYLIGFTNSADYFEYPSFRDETEFGTDNYFAMLSFILEKSGREFRCYFADRSNRETPFTMMFLNKDGSLFLGVGAYSEYSNKYQNKLKADFDSNPIMICHQVVPPDSLADSNCK